MMPLQHPLPPPRALARLAVLLLLLACPARHAAARDGQVNLFTDGTSPIVIDQPGSYVLVADATMLDDLTGIRVEA